MKAIVYERYGGPEVLELREIETPEPKPREVRVRSLATTVTTGDWRVRSLALPPGFGPVGRLMFGLRRPRQTILGTELAGVVDAVGARVTRFKPGDSVVAVTGGRLGCHVEYKCLAEDAALILKPEALSFEEAAALGFGGLAALTFLRDKGRIRPGEAVLINGASGAVGSAAVQIAKHLGATVTGVASGASLELVRSLGADAAIDYTREDFRARGQVWDAILDAAGTVSIADARACLRERGRLLMVLTGLGGMLAGPLASRRGGRAFLSGTASERPEDLRALAHLAQAGAYRPVIDSVYPFERFREAHARVEAGHKRGNVVLRLAASDG